MRLVLALIASSLAVHRCAAQDLNLNPTRPTVSNSATVQGPHVLQVELGYDAFPQRVPGDQQTVGTLVTYTALPRLRLDLGWSSFQHVGTGAEGTGDISIGGKFVVHQEEYHRRPPGVAVQYEAELPTASRSQLRSYGQQAIVLLNHHYLPNGILDVIVNGSLVQVNCQTASGCGYGGQHAVALSYHLQKTTRLYAEVFAQNLPASNAPPGTYVFTGFFHNFKGVFGLDGGVRFGVSDHASSIGTTVGIVFGRHVPRERAHPGGAVRP